MIDRFGHHVNVGWAEHEDLWIEAANTLVEHSRFAALREIADLTGRKYSVVRARAAHMRARDRRQAEIAARRRALRAMSQEYERSQAARTAA